MASEILRSTISAAVERNPADMLLLSGGIDSSALAAMAPTMSAVTVIVNHDADDGKFARKVAEHLEMHWALCEIPAEQAIDEGLPNLVKLLESFDAGMINDLPLLYGMRHASEAGASTVMTGECADWLFAGYPFLWRYQDRVNEYVAEALPHVPYSSRKLAAHFGLRLVQPYLDEAVIGQALSIPFSEKVRSNLGFTKYTDVYIDKDASTRNELGSPAAAPWSKIVLRESFAAALPEDVVWRPRADLEFGSGMSSLHKYMDIRMTDDEFLSRKANCPARIWGGKLQLYLYSTFIGLFGSVRALAEGEVSCPNCGFGVDSHRSHCRVCGAYPILGECGI